MNHLNKKLKIALSVITLVSLFSYQVTLAEEVGEATTPVIDTGSSDNSGSSKSSGSPDASDSLDSNSNSDSGSADSSENLDVSDSSEPSDDPITSESTDASKSSDSENSETNEVFDTDSSETDSDSDTSSSEPVETTELADNSKTINDPETVDEETSNFETADSTPVAPLAAENEESLQTIQIKLTVAANENILSSELTAVTACNNGSGAVTLNGWCAITQAAAAKGWTIASSSWGSDTFLNSINEYSDSSGTYWFWFNGTEFGSISLNTHVLTENEHLSIVFGTSPLKVTVDSATPLFGTTTTISVYQFGFDETWSPVWTPAESSTLLINGNSATTTNGVYEYHNFHPNPVSITGSKTGFITSDDVTLTPTSPSTPIRLKIQTFDQVLFDDELQVSVCPETRETAEVIKYSLSAWCAVGEAVRQINGSYQGNWFDGPDVFLETVNEYETDYSQGKFWSWYADLTLGETGLNKHYLTENEELLLTFKINPIKIEVSSSTPSVGATTTVSVYELDFTQWPATWVPLASSTVYVNDVIYELSGSTYDLAISGTTTIKATKSSYVDSNKLIISPFTVQNSSNSGSGSSALPENQNQTSTFNVNAAGNFLHTKQNSDGAIGSASLYSDWAAIAIGSLGNSSAKSGLANYLKTDPSPGTTATDYERRAMALLALGINPYTGTPTNYIALIMQKYDGNQFGDAGLVNDDIFALFPLLKSGYTTSDVEIQKAVTFILSKQNGAGGWESPDLTAAAVQALSQVTSISGVSDALTRAKNYLKVSTKTDGRIGDNVFSTSWGVQALTALGESVTTWNGSNPSPLNYLAIQQQSDGGVNAVADTNDNRIWATSYAIPGAQGKTWESILISVPKFTSNNSTGNSTIDSTTTSTTATTTTQTATTTPQSVIATTTTQFVTTTPEIITSTTSQTIETETIPIVSTDSVLPTTESPENATSTPTVSRTLLETNLDANTAQRASSGTEVPNKASREQLNAPSPQNPASGQNKALFGGAAALASTAGAYLAWRFIQGLV